MAGPDIFLSYNREDVARAKHFADAFASEGFEVWWDVALRSGEAYDEVTEAALRNAKAVVVLWSPRSVASRWVRAEATVGLRNETLAPAMIEPCRRPVMFELTQTAELSHWRGNRTDPAWRSFVEDIRGFVGGKVQPRSGPEPGDPKGFSGSLFQRLRYPIVAFLALSGLLLAGGAWWWNSSGSEAIVDPPLRITAFVPSGGKRATLYAQSLKEAVIDGMGDAGIPVTEDTPAGSPVESHAGLELSGSIVETGDDLKVFAQIRDVSSGVTLWSNQFEGKVTDTDRLSTEVTVALTDPLYTVREVNLQKGLKLDPSIMALEIKGLTIINNPRAFEEGMARRNFEDANARAPNVAYGHALLALTLVQDGARAPEDQRSALLERAEDEANRALEIDPAASGIALDALYLMSVFTEPGQLVRQEDRLLEGLRNAPENAFLNMRECQFLLSVGRIERAWPFCQRARAIRPLTAPVNWRYAVALKLRGQQTLAEQAIDQTTRYYPDNGQIRVARLDILAFGNSYQRAGALLPQLLDQSEGFGSTETNALKLYLDARASGSIEAIERAAAAIQSAATSGKLRLDLAVEALGALNRTDQAFALLEGIDHALPPQMDQAQANPGTSFLFAPEAASLRADPRFWQVAFRQGLVAYWLKRNEWPDFCGKQMPLKDCKAQAIKAQVPVVKP